MQQSNVAVSSSAATCASREDDVRGVFALELALRWRLDLPGTNQQTDRQGRTRHVSDGKQKPSKVGDWPIAAPGRQHGQGRDAEDNKDSGSQQFAQADSALSRAVGERTALTTHCRYFHGDVVERCIALRAPIASITAAPALRAKG
jgi:hypothetical protein